MNVIPFSGVAMTVDLERELREREADLQAFGASMDIRSSSDRVDYLQRSEYIERLRARLAAAVTR